MNNEEQSKICPQCGNILTPEGNCPVCGYQKPIEQNTINTNEVVEEQPKKGGIGKAILRTVFFNVLTLAVVYVVLILIYYGGGKENKYTYYLALLIALAYFVYRIFYKIRSLCNKVKLAKTVIDDPKGTLEKIKIGLKEHKKAVIVVIILIILYFIPVIFPKDENQGTYLTKNKIEEKTIFDNESLKIIQKRINYNKDNVSIRLSITGKDGNDLMCYQLANTRVNRYLLNYDYANTSLDKKTGDCILTIKNEQLKKYEIEDIYMIDFWLNNNIVTIKTNSSKTSNDNSFFKKDDSYKLYENDYFNIYYGLSESNLFSLYIESKIKEDYTLQISDIDIDDIKISGIIGTELYDYTVFKKSQGIDACSDNLSYFKAKYIIYDKDQTVIAEDVIEKEYDRSLIIGNCEK